MKQAFFAADCAISPQQAWMLNNQNNDKFSRSGIFLSSLQSLVEAWPNSKVLSWALLCLTRWNCEQKAAKMQKVGDLKFKLKNLRENLLKVINMRNA